MPVLLSSPEPTRPVPPPAPPTPLPEVTPYVRSDYFPGLDSVLWTGWNGATWELLCPSPHDPATGVALGRRVRGLHFGEVETFASESPAVDGAAPLGYVVKPREVFLALRVFQATSSQAWVEHDRAFWRSMLPAAPGVRGPGRLTITHPNGDRRWLELWPQHKGDHEYDVDPTRRGWAMYGQYLTAYRPYWTTDPVAARTFTAGGASGFFGGSAGGRGAPFVIGDAGLVGSAVIDNPGDEPAWPVWRLHGPFTQVKIGVPGALSTLSMTVGAGETITVDTDPLAQSITDQTGTPRMPGALAGAPFVAVPPGQNQALVAEMTGGGRIEATLQPLYHRAW